MTDEMIEDAALFERVQYWKEFQPEAKNLFPTESALRWFIRQHDPALVDLDVLLKLPRGNYIDPEPFRAAAINLMRQPSVNRQPSGDSDSRACSTKIRSGELP